MTSLELFRHPETESTPPIDWGTTEPRHIPVDATLYRTPTFLQKYNFFFLFFVCIEIKKSDF